MGNVRWAKLVLLGAAVVMLGAACTSSSNGGETNAAPTSAALSVEERCQVGAERIVDRLVTFADGFGDVSPDEFLGQDEVEGLSSFQDDVAGIIAETVNQSSTLCNLDGLQLFLDDELARIENPSLLTDYLVSSIRQGGTREVADVVLGPDDDIQPVLDRLDDGSTVTLERGNYVFEAALLFQHDIAIVGAGIDETTISSSSADAALAVFGQGKLTLRDLTVVHTGDQEASVLLAFGAPVDVERVKVQGATSEEATSGGNGILLSTGSVTEDGVTQEAGPDDDPVAPSRIVNSEILDNDVAGITVIGQLAPTIASNDIYDNVLCGLCYLGESAGSADQNTVRGNEFGIQIGDNAAPIVTSNTVRDNSVAGMVVLATATPQVSSNNVTQNGEVGIAVQGESSPAFGPNTITGQTFGMTVVGSSTPSIVGVTIVQAEVGIQAAEFAQPRVSGTTIQDATGIGIVLRDDAGGSFVDVVVEGQQPVGALIEGRSAPVIENISVSGSDVSVSYREQGGGSLTASTFTDPAIAIQLEDEAGPTIAANTILRPEAAGLVIRSTGLVQVTDNEIIDPVSLGIGVAGSSNPFISSNSVTGGESAFSLVEEASGEIRNNTLTGQVVAIQIGDSAAPMLVENRIVDSQGAAIVYRDNSSGEAVENSIVNPLSVGIQVVDSAAPELGLNILLSGFVDPENQGAIPDADQAENDPQPAAENGASDQVIDDAENGSENEPENDATEEPADAPEDSDEDDSTVGILFAASAAGTASENQILGFVIGLQVSESATPELTENFVDGGDELGVGILFRDDSAGSAQGNRLTNHSIGVQISDRASPLVENNVVERATDVGFLLQGTVEPVLNDNVCPISIPGIGLLEQANPTLGKNDCQVIDG